MPSGSFEADLRATREARGLSLGDIQQQTRIPVDVLRRFEEGDLIGDPTYNEVYLKAFLQSYAKSVGVPGSAALAALTAQKNGTYAGALHPDFDPARAPQAPKPSPAPSEPPPARATPEAGRSETDEPASRPSAPPASAAPPAVQALRNAPAPDARPATPDRPKTLAQARVNRPAVPTARRSFDKNWTTILALFGAVVVALALAFYFLIFAGDSPEDDAPDTVAVGTEPGDEVAIDSSGIGAGAAAGGPRLQFPIRAVVTAGGDGLQSFRVTEDGGDRRPYWIDLGTSETYEADSLLVLWGEDPSSDFSEATVEIQGLRFTPQSGRAFRVDRQNGQAVLDSLAAATPGPAAPASAAVPAADPAAFE